MATILSWQNKRAQFLAANIFNSVVYMSPLCGYGCWASSSTYSYVKCKIQASVEWLDGLWNTDIMYWLIQWKYLWGGCVISLDPSTISFVVRDDSVPVVHFLYCTFSLVVILKCSSLKIKTDEITWSEDCKFDVDSDFGIKWSTSSHKQCSILMLEGTN